ncbi:MAG: GNAT family N-acetyltransferase [Alphaproteobacteria bacterium]|nr:GNAT family N-acetyltransferase [Alphaproteobacteria bacterium]
MILPERIETRRLILERPKPTFDLAQEIFTYVQLSLNNLQPWLPWANVTDSVEGEFAYLLNWCDQHWNERTGFAYVIRDKDINRFLGMIDVIKIDEKNKIGEIGFWLQNNAQGQGFMREALKALDKQCFIAGLNRIEVRNDTRNIASANVAQRAGYHLDGVLRQDKWSKYDNKFVDTNVWSKLKGE